MIDLLRRLFAPDPAPFPDPDARVALAALLVRVAKSDGTYLPAEIARIDRILVARYGLNPVEAMRLRAQAEDVERDAPDTVRFTRAIKAVVPWEDRLGVVEALWSVVIADGVRGDDEAAILRTVAPLLGVSDPDSALARHRAETALAARG
ncbi:MAG: TerB family tellurite resistance protein [Rubellimicrobium sp.]|nr:TerB family tellurite resistance protein [Rubellimicrobium sp.]